MPSHHILLVIFNILRITRVAPELQQADNSRQTSISKNRFHIDICPPDISMEHIKREYGVSKPTILRSHSAFGEANDSTIVSVPYSNQAFISVSSTFGV